MTSLSRNHVVIMAMAMAPMLQGKVIITASGVYMRSRYANSRPVVPFTPPGMGRPPRPSRSKRRREKMRLERNNSEGGGALNAATSGDGEVGEMRGGGGGGGNVG